MNDEIEVVTLNMLLEGFSEALAINRPIWCSR